MPPCRTSCTTPVSYTHLDVYKRQALYSSFAVDYYFYPAEGRTLFGSVRYDFR